MLVILQILVQKMSDRGWSGSELQRLASGCAWLQIHVIAASVAARTAGS